MNAQQSSAIVSFFAAVAELQQVGVIRSSRYLGDIGEFLCESAFGTKLSEHLRQADYDGLQGDKRVQIKFNNSTAGNNIPVGSPDKYDMLVVVIGPTSKLREADHQLHEFRLYSFVSSEVVNWKAKGGGHYCAKKRLASCKSKQSLFTGHGVGKNSED